MTTNPLTDDEKLILLRLARQTIEEAVKGQPIPACDPKKYSQSLQDDGASFVTLTEFGDLRGCIGALEAYQPLVQDVCEHAAASALQDYRFPQVRPDEVDHLEIEISRLTAPKALEYKDSSDLLEKLRPGEDGVIIRDGMRRATFLPQVWEKIPTKEGFLSQLCMKMGAPSDLWRHKHLAVLIYTVEEFSEAHYLNNKKAGG
jgi:uncharacterized protein